MNRALPVAVGKVRESCGGARQHEAARPRHPLLEGLEPGHDVLDVLADDAVVARPSRASRCRRRTGRARRARSRSRPRCAARCEAGSEPAARGVHHAHRVLDGDELLAARLHVALGPAQAGQQQRLPARGTGASGSAWSRRARSARSAQRGRGDVGVRRGGDEVAAQREEHVDLAVAHGPDRVDGVPAVLAGRRRSRTRRPACPGSASGIFSQMPIVRSPCTLLCPRIGDGPAPGRPMLPRSSRKLTISRIVATALRCWVSPIAQQTITLSAATTSRRAPRSAARDSPLCCSIVGPVERPPARRRQPRSRRSTGR